MVAVSARGQSGDGCWRFELGTDEDRIGWRQGGWAQQGRLEWIGDGSSSAVKKGISISDDGEEARPRGIGDVDCVGGVGNPRGLRKKMLVVGRGEEIARVLWHRTKLGEHGLDKGGFATSSTVRETHGQ